MSITIEKENSNDLFLQERNLKSIKDLPCENKYCIAKLQGIYKFTFKDANQELFLIGGYCDECISFMNKQLKEQATHRYFMELAERSILVLQTYLDKKSIADIDDEDKYTTKSAGIPMDGTGSTGTITTSTWVDDGDESAEMPTRGSEYPIYTTGEAERMDYDSINDEADIREEASTTVSEVTERRNSYDTGRSINDSIIRENRETINRIANDYVNTAREHDGHYEVGGRQVTTQAEDLIQTLNP